VEPERHDEHRPPVGSEAWWRDVLTSPEANFEPFRNFFLRLPSAPHCKLCGAPFKGPGGLVLGRLGFQPWEKNPTLCRACIKQSSRVGPGGAEVPCTLLFADVRGSTGMAERSSATDFAALLRRFYAVGSQAVIDQRGIVDKYVGDEVVALFIPAFSGPMHARAAIRSARDLLARTGHGSEEGPWLRVGIGVHSGLAFVGTVAVGSEVTDFTALGDTVNAAARLASEAQAGELIVSEAALEVAGFRLDGSERRELRLRGREALLPVRVAHLETLAEIEFD
jgi:adenylate cyclase